jgi:hypothetical protein
MNVVGEDGYVFNPNLGTYTRAVGWQQAGWGSGELAKKDQNFYQLQITIQNGVATGRSILHFHLSTNCNVSLVRDIPYPFSIQHNVSLGLLVSGSGMCYAYTAGGSDVLALGSSGWNNHALQWYNSQSGSSYPVPLNQGGFWVTKVGIPPPNAPAGTPLYLAPMFQTENQISGDLVYIPSDNSYVGSFGNNPYVGGNHYVRHFKAPQGTPSGTIPQAVNLGTDYWPAGDTAWSVWSNGDNVYMEKINPQVWSPLIENFKFDLSSHTLIPSNVSAVWGNDVASSPECYSIAGCTDPTAQNYDPTATVDDGSCIATVYGCTDPVALNYYPGANVDDGSCCYTSLVYDPACNCAVCVGAGCTDPTATNYDPLATPDDGSCTYPPPVNPCNDPWTNTPGLVQVCCDWCEENALIAGGLYGPPPVGCYDWMCDCCKPPIIKDFDLDLSDIPAAGESRAFTVTGENDAEFKLEIRDKDTGYYYNFVTNAFQATKAFLEGVIK